MSNVCSGSIANKSTIEPSRSATSSSKDKFVGGLFTFDAPTFSSRVGISWISKEQACQNVNSQIPEGTSFSSVVEDTKKVWNSEILAKITTTTKNTTNLGLLYTSLYFMNLLPTNQTGENPGWDSTAPYYSDTFTLWDTFRCTTPLNQILTPQAYEEYVHSLIDIWEHDGYMPDGGLRTIMVGHKVVQMRTTC